MLCIIKRADGGVSITSLADPPLPAEQETAPERKEARALMTPQAVMQGYLTRWSASAKPEWLPATIETFEGSLPADKTYRDAWESSGSVVIVNMNKARAIHRNRMRARRGDETADAQSMRRPDKFGEAG